MPLPHPKVLLPLGIIVLSTVIAVGLFLLRPAPKVVDTTLAPLLVDAIEVVKEDIQVSVRAQGTITPRTSTSLIAEVTGRITQVSAQFKVGAYFTKDEPLLYIDQRDYLAAVKRAEAAVASARSLLASEKGRAEVAYQDWIKYERSVKRSENATALALRKPQLEEAQAQLDSALADLSHARDQLDRTVIRAPYDGVVRNKQVDIGQYVNAGTLLAETFAIDTAELRLALPEHKLNYLQLPTLANSNHDVQPKVQLFAEIGGSLQQWQARIVRTEGVFDERSRVLFAVAEVEDPYGIYSERKEELRIGTFVEANIEGRVFKGLVSLPRYLLRAGNRIWVIDKQNTLQNRQVSVLRTDGPEIYVTAGLEQGELVCSSTISGAIPGTQVRIADKVPSNQQRKTPAPDIIEPARQPQLDLAPVSKPAAEPVSEPISETATKQDQAA